MAKYGIIKGAYSFVVGDKSAIIDYEGEHLLEVRHSDGSRDLYTQSNEKVLIHIKHIKAPHTNRLGGSFGSGATDTTPPSAV